MLFSISSISAEDVSPDLNLNDEIDDVAIETTSNTNYDKEIYVSTTGNDDNSGVETSPYKTINKGISSVNASDNAVIHLSEGTFTGENNTALDIKLSHKNYNGSLTFIGAGYNKTFLNGDNAAAIFNSISQDSIVTFINLTFINGKNTQGGAIVSQGVLTIDNCIFENNYATSSLGGAINQQYNDVIVKNSLFINNSAGSNGGAFFASGMQNVDLINTIFINNNLRNTYGYGGAAYIYASNKTNVSGNKFINTTTKSNSYDAALYLTSTNEGYFANNVFINCTNLGTSYAIVYLAGNNIVKNNTFINSVSNDKGHIYNAGMMNLYVTYEDAYVTNPVDIILKAKVTDDMGNRISGETYANSGINFNITKGISSLDLGSAAIVNGTSTLKFTRLLDNGVFVLGGKYLKDYNNMSVITPGTLTVNIDQTPITLYVDVDGSDVSGDGSKNNPFKTLNYAIVYGFYRSLYTTIYMGPGVFSGVNNTNITCNELGNLTLIGDGYNLTVIDGNNTDWFLKTGSYINLVLKNLTYTNGYLGKYISGLNGLISAGNTIISDCIIYNNNPRYSTSILYINGGFINNLTFNNNKANTNLISVGNSIIDNSYFFNNTNSYSNSPAPIISGGYLTVNNSLFINNTGLVSANQQGKSMNNRFLNNTGFINNFILSQNDQFINNTGNNHVFVGFSNTNNNYDHICNVINSTFINNKNGAVKIYIGSVIDSKFINNTADYGAAIYLDPSYYSNYYPNVNRNITVKNCTFTNNFVYKNGQDIYISSTIPNNNYIPARLNNLTITFKDINITSVADTITAVVEHPSGAIIGGFNVNFYLDNKLLGSAELINGSANLQYIGFSNGTYVLSGKYNGEGNFSKYINGTVIVGLLPLDKNVTLYVSSVRGNDANNGSFENPFKTIQMALNYAYKKSDNITIYILEGVYSGYGNTNLIFPSSLNLTVIGEGNKTIIDGQQESDFVTITPGSNFVTIENLSVINSSIRNAPTVYPWTNVKDVHSPIWVLEGANLIINNVYFEGNGGSLGGAVLNAGNTIINNCSFVKNGFKGGYGGAVFNNGSILINDSFFLANYAYRGSHIFSTKLLIINNSFITDSYWFSGSHYGAVVGINAPLLIENTIFFNSGKTAEENGRYDLGSKKPYTYIGGFNNAIIKNSHFEYNSTLPADDIFGSYYGSMAEYNSQDIVEFYNCTFENIKNLVAVTSRAGKGNITVENCVINITGKVYVGNTANFVNITDCVILNSNVVSWSSNFDGLLDFNYNWWCDNVQPSYSVGENVSHPDFWLVLNLSATNSFGLLRELILSFKVANGTNISDYNGSLPLRVFFFNTTDGILTPVSGDLTNNISVIFQSLSFGNKTINVTVDGFTLSSILDLNLVDVNLAVNNTTVDASDNFNIPVNVTIENGIVNNGTVIITVNGKNYTANVIDGIANIILNAPELAGVYDCLVYYDGLNIYNNATSSFKLTVSKLNTVLNVNDTSGYVDENIVVKVDVLSKIIVNNGTVTINVGGKNYTAVVTNGFALVNIIAPSHAGTFKYNVYYNGDNTFNNQESVFTLYVNNKNVNISVDDVSTVVGKSVIVPVTVRVLNVLASSGIVTITVDGKNYSANVSNGLANVQIIAPNAPNLYEMIITYNDQGVNGTKLAQMTVNKINVVLNTNDDISVNVGENFTVNVNVTSSEGVVDSGTVIVNFNDKNYTANVVNGEASLSINAPVDGKYTLTVSYNGGNTYQNMNTTVNLNVNKFNTELNVSVDDIVVGETAIIFITVKDSDATGVVIVKVGNDERSVNLVNGKGNVSLSGIPKGTYNVVAFYEGNDKYNNASGNASFSVKDESRTFLNVSDVVMYYLDGTRLVVILTDNNGNPLVNQNVTIFINGRNNTRTTNSTGHASIAINLNPGEYAVVTTYNGDGEYLASKVNSTVTVKSTVIGQDLVKYYRNGSQYYVTVLDNDGKPMAGVSVLMNINGVFYNRTTDSDGRAMLSINLNPGNYIITVEHPVSGLKMSNNITVLSTVQGSDLVKYYRNGSQYHVKIVDEQGIPVKNTNVTMNINGVFYVRTTNDEG
ncbi:MAG: Ig-like domain repeat protein, partial [Methanobacteriaceae archaeon]|nr:Ig-like domain repeat protein [Methanobacteriaceae archaeon]